MTSRTAASSVRQHCGHFGSAQQQPGIHALHKVLYVQEVVTLQKKYFIYLQQKMKITQFINYYDTLG